MVKKYGLFVFLLLFIPGKLMAEIKDPLAAGPNIYRIQFENEKTRVLDAHYRPGQKSEIHSYPDHLLYVIESSRLREIFEDGHYQDTQPKVGELTWIKAGVHSLENLGDTDYHAFLVEIKSK